MKIVLIGYRCTGKTAIGKKLAQALALPFYDTDALIEEAAGMTIKEMVDQKSWPYFRDREKDCIRKVGASTDAVIATGGGVVMNDENAAILKEGGIVVWLTADVDTILRRLAADQATQQQRPPLSDADVRRETENILKERMPVYGRLADITIDTVRYDIAEAVEEIRLRITQDSRSKGNPG